jgi:hypothetical protein
MGEKPPVSNGEEAVEERENTHQEQRTKTNQL